ncbi:MAG: MBL fold metallo-hydrolase [Firmicutes bacterium]|nr:MBL fold metallo-hydrolase [Bacillota bacterium]
MKKILSIITAAVMSLGLCACGSAGLNGGSQLEVHYIDVGQADSALVICGGETMMIDGGNVADSDVVAAYLKKQDISTLDYVVCSHAHEDHVGGLSGALSVTEAKHVYAPETEATSKAYTNFKKKVSEQGLEIEHPQAGDSFSLGGGTVEFLGPIDEDGKDMNSTSIVLKITYGETSFLFTGDAERDEEEEILDSGADLKSTVLKVGHHGSDTSTSYPFLREIMPQYAVISVGKDNSYGHPTDDTLSRLEDAGAQIYRTDLNGDIVMKSDGKNITVTTSK